MIWYNEENINKMQKNIVTSTQYGSLLFSAYPKLHTGIHSLTHICLLELQYCCCLHSDHKSLPLFFSFPCVISCFTYLHVL